MIIGFTGRREGMDESQLKKIIQLIEDVIEDYPGEIVTGLHGDCVGADAEFHTICRELGLHVHQRPCTFESMRAYTDAEVIAEPKNPMSRNRDIVDDADIMLAAPPTQYEIKRGSGTWATIRYTRESYKELHVAYPEPEEKE